MKLGLFLDYAQATISVPVERVKLAEELGFDSVWTAEAELKVCIVTKPGESATAEGIARFVNDNAPHFFVPRYIEFVDELPLTPTGRVQKYKLRERGLTPETWDARAAGFKLTR